MSALRRRPSAWHRRSVRWPLAKHDGVGSASWRSANRFLGGCRRHVGGPNRFSRDRRVVGIRREGNGQSQSHHPYREGPDPHFRDGGHSVGIAIDWTFVSLKSDSSSLSRASLTSASPRSHRSAAGTTRNWPTLLNRGG